MLFGIIEFARILQAWLSVENGARFGVRYAVTGEYDVKYCAQADADFPGLRGRRRRRRPDRLHCAQQPNPATRTRPTRSRTTPGFTRSSEVATGGALAILRDPATGLAQTDKGFFKVTVCSSRNVDGDTLADFQLLDPIPGQFLPAMCVEDPDGTQTDPPFPVAQSVNQETMDPGGPGDRVYVIVDFNHPVIVPLISSMWPKLHLTSQRQGIVERFRIARVSACRRRWRRRP